MYIGRSWLSPALLRRQLLWMYDPLTENTDKCCLPEDTYTYIPTPIPTPIPIPRPIPTPIPRPRPIPTPVPMPIPMPMPIPIPTPTRTSRPGSTSAASGWRARPASAASASFPGTQGFQG